MRIASGLLPGHVLQRGAKGASATVSGATGARGPVIATITATARKSRLRGWSKRTVGTARGGAFTARLSGIPTGGPYVVTLSAGGESVVVGDVYVGDLWLMAGQSNMEGVGDLVDAPRPHPLVRNFTMARRWELARDPLTFLGESPDRVHSGGAQQDPATAKASKRSAVKGVGIGVYFGVEMHRRTGVPQGLIATAHGGTSMEQWDPAKRDQGGESLYGSMLASLRAVGQPIAGVLWYQGESDAHAAAVALYTRRMQALVAAIRADLRQKDLPFLTVQISRVVSAAWGAPASDWNAIQDLQRRLPRVIRNLDVVPAVDLELDDLIHISAKAYATLAERMVRGAARLVLGDRRERPAPEPISARLLRDHPSAPAIEVRFVNVVGGLRSSGLPRGFALVDRQHQPVDLIYKTVLDGDSAIVHLQAIDRDDLRLMYGRGLDATCTLVDGRGMSALVAGPLPIEGLPVFSPWMRSWDVSGVREGERIEKLARPTPKSVGGTTRRDWSNGTFIDLHSEWQGRSGHAACYTTIDAAEDMDLEALLGYDGPIRVWIDDRELYRDLKGTNPAVADRARAPLRLRKGRHQVTVVMALNRGNAWGFFLRFARTDLSTAERESGQYYLPLLRR